MTTFIKVFGGLALCALLVSEVFRIKEIYESKHVWRIIIGCVARILMMLMYLLWLLELPIVAVQVVGGVSCMLFVGEALAYMLEPNSDKLYYSGKHIQNKNEQDTKSKAMFQQKKW